MKRSAMPEFFDVLALFCFALARRCCRALAPSAIARRRLATVLTRRARAGFGIHTGALEL